MNKRLEGLKIPYSIELKTLKIEDKSETISASTKKEIENEQLKRIGQATLKTGAFAGFGIVCAGVGALGFGYYIISQIRW